MIESVVPMRVDGVLEAEVDGDRVLMSPKKYDYFGLVDTGALVWDMIDGQRTIGQILDELQAEFNADPEQIREDVLDFLAGLEAAGLVESLGSIEN